MRYSCFRNLVEDFGLWDLVEGFGLETVNRKTETLHQVSVLRFTLSDETETLGEGFGFPQDRSLKPQDRNLVTETLVGGFGLAVYGSRGKRGDVSEMRYSCFRNLVEGFNILLDNWYI